MPSPAIPPEAGECSGGPNDPRPVHPADCRRGHDIDDQALGGAPEGLSF
jgi:hypothetical protein